MDEILEILERHPDWKIQAGYRSPAFDNGPRDLELRMQTEEAGQRITDEMATSAQQIAESRHDVLRFVLKRMEQRMQCAIEKHLTPTGDNQRQGT